MSDTVPEPGQSAALDEVLMRLARQAKRHPICALRRYESLEQLLQSQGNMAAAIDVLYTRFNLLEHMGRAQQLLGSLNQAQGQAATAGLSAQAARMLEALGRIAYQTGDYLMATEKWTRAIDLAQLVGELRIGVAARIGLGQIHYAMGAWDNGRRFHRDAANLLASLDDSYLEAKLALNLGVGNYENSQLEEAEQQFSKGLAAARRGQHLEFEAEALWHLARAALLRGQTDLAAQQCRLALDMATRLGHLWLESVASQTWTEIALARNDHAEALKSAQFALEQALRIQSRAQESRSHQQLAQLYQSQGNLKAALTHLWKHVDVQAEIERLSLPERLAKLAHYDISRKPPDELLLELSNQQWPLESTAELKQAFLELSAKAQKILALDKVSLWWANEVPGVYVLLQQQPVDGDGGGDDNSAQAPRLSEPAQAAYLKLLTQRREPLFLADLSLHPCLRELSGLGLMQGASSQIEIPLFVQQQLRAVLWLTQHGQARAWSRQDQLQASHLGKVFERVLLSADLALAQQTQALMEQEKADALGRLVAGVAHEVNTPIGVAVTAASSVSDNAQRLVELLASERISRSELQLLSARLKTGSELVERNLERAAGLIGNFKKVTVDQASEAVSEFQLADYLSSVISVLSPALRKAGVEVSLAIDPEIELYMASGLLTQVISNLIMNSIYHAFPERRGGKIRISARQDEHHVWLDVADDGIGVSAAVRARMFEPFFTTKRGQGGSGLGMYIVQSIMERIGGSIELPETEQGLCVRLGLPVQKRS
ncbi:HAMP domain-containing histidine kinase [Paucibacter sp. B2R-40]|uniref:sensor histidine kinase n=1 Tax=Paucibacter sp. B2R-40 TaxID=2893554 RepID=UPI0021E4E27F|nr:HAMP domain-containing sensor histidine kinase [Paucibacter sp. B2R-40]MCV2354870.1 HAMP domain-containing histidine kinase [Paucibacter sp. B2R-40]